MTPVLAPDDHTGLFVGRITGPQGPMVVTLREGRLIDITAKAAPTVRDIAEMSDPAGYVRDAVGVDLGVLDDLNPALWLAPCDMQAVKACGVTFARSMVERVIEEKAAGDPARAAQVRARVADLIGGSLRNLKA
jgi:fumarylacetoacetate (FAA) hydrolase family protein